MAIPYGSQHGRVYACQAPPVLSDAYSECQNMTMPAFTLPPMDCLPAPVLIVEDESLMREKLQADAGYSGLITKTPGHARWMLLRGPRRAYDLDELAEYLPGLEKHRPKRRAEEVGLGRNVTLFDALRIGGARERNLATQLFEERL